jgi:hypothetical protein
MRSKLVTDSVGGFTLKTALSINKKTPTASNVGRTGITTKVCFGIEKQTKKKNDA